MAPATLTTDRETLTRALETLPIEQTRASLTRARVELGERLAECYGTTRDGIRLPQGYAVTVNAQGFPLTDSRETQNDYLRSAVGVRLAKEYAQAIANHLETLSARD